jgi:hypothetical protein
MNVIRIAAQTNGIKGRDRKVKFHYDRLYDVEVKDKRDYNLITSSGVLEYIKPYIEKNSIFDNYKKLFKNIQKLTLTIQYVEIDYSNGFRIEKCDLLDKKIATLL